MSSAPIDFVNRLVPRSIRKVVRYYAAHYGSRYRCPFCQSGLRRLQPAGLDAIVLDEKKVVGAGRRDNCICPVCRSVDRERLVWLYLRDHDLLAQRPLRLLHFAPEPRLRAGVLAQEGIDYTTADLERRNVDVRMDVTDIPFPDRHFDAIICNHVLEHIPRDRRAMAELLRVLKPGGWAILQVPMSKILEVTFEDPSVVTDDERERVFGQDDHVRIYAGDYVDRLRGVGFDVDPFDWTAHGERYGAPENRYALIEGEEVFMARRPSSA